MYRAGKRWCYAVTVTDKLLYGGSIPITNDLGEVAGCHLGGQISLASRLGDQTLRWTATQPTCASIQRFLRDLGMADGDLVFLQLPVDGTFDVTLADPAWRTGPPLTRVLASIGATTEHANQALQTIAAACDLKRDSAVADLLDQLHHRGGPDLSDALKEASRHAS